MSRIAPPAKVPSRCYPGPMRGMSWCSDSVERYLFSSSTRCLCVFAPPSRLSRSSSCAKRCCQLLCDDRGPGGKRLERTLLRLISSCLRCASVFPKPELELPGCCCSLGVKSRSDCGSFSEGAASAVSAFLLSLAVSSVGFAALSFELLLFLLFFLTPASLAPPLSFRPPDTVDV